MANSTEDWKQIDLLAMECLSSQMAISIVAHSKEESLVMVYIDLFRHLLPTQRIVLRRVILEWNKNWKRNVSILEW